MDHVSSPTSVTSSFTATSTTTLKQPTYTTAGTIYTPNTSQPLQPPTRRGRSYKWLAGSNYADLALLPKSVLASLPLRSGASRTPVHQQYSPLQQNNHRAISPSLIEDQEPQTGRDMMGDEMDNVHLPAEILPSLFAGSSQDKSIAEEESDGSDSDTDFGSNPLMGLTFKSLQNLASYPNPNQKRARRHLLGAKPNLTGLANPARNLASPKPTLVRPVGSPPKSESGLSETMAPWKILRRPQTGSHGRTKGSHDDHPGLMATARAQELNSRKSTLSDGPGAPLPLTAGPPGRRQYGPSTFDATFKALQTKASHKASVASAHEQPQLGMDGLRPTTSSGPLFAAPQSRNSTPPRAVDQALPYQGSRNNQNEPFVASTVRAPAVTPPSTTDDQGQSFIVHEPGLPSLRDEREESRSRFEEGTDRLTSAEIKTRNDKNDQIWNSGAGLMKKSTEDTYLEARFQAFEQRVGVIGDGRTARKTDQYPSMTIKEANKTEVSAHTKPLLNLGFEALVRTLSFNKTNGKGCN